MQGNEDQWPTMEDTVVEERVLDATFRPFITECDTVGNALKDIAADTKGGHEHTNMVKERRTRREALNI